MAGSSQREEAGVALHDDAGGPRPPRQQLQAAGIGDAPSPLRVGWFRPQVVDLVAALAGAGAGHLVREPLKGDVRVSKEFSPGHDDGDGHLTGVERRAAVATARPRIRRLAQHPCIFMEQNQANTA
jgi:hypothetical protein